MCSFTVKHECAHAYMIVKRTYFTLYILPCYVSAICHSGDATSVNSCYIFAGMFTSLKPSEILIRDFISVNDLGGGGL